MDLFEKEKKTGCTHTLWLWKNFCVVSGLLLLLLLAAVALTCVRAIPGMHDADDAPIGMTEGTVKWALLRLLHLQAGWRKTGN